MARHPLWFLVLVVAALLLLGPWQLARAESPIQVGVVLQEGEDRVDTYCATITVPNPSGYDALVATGVPIVAAISPQGVGVCQIGDRGCPAGNCFCQCQGAVCNYWAYSYLSDGDWLTSSVGAGARRVGHGDVEGWRWGPGNPPQLYTFEQICKESAVPEPGAPRTDRMRGDRQLSLLLPVAITLGAAAIAIAISHSKRSS